jgi:hypothetical protein
MVHLKHQIRTTALVALVIVASSANAAEGACDRGGLLAMLHEAPRLEAPPQTSKVAPNRTFQFRLHESPLIMDGFKYDGVVDATGGLAWIVQYGGISGSLEWFGPLPIEPAKFLDCPQSLSFRSTPETQVTTYPVLGGRD